MLIRQVQVGEKTCRIIQTFIIFPPKPKREKRVGIYCRVSTNSMDHLHSLTAQISHLTRLIASMLQWVLADVYIDIATS